MKVRMVCSCFDMGSPGQTDLAASFGLARIAVVLGAPQNCIGLYEEKGAVGNADRRQAVSEIIQK